MVWIGLINTYIIMIFYENLSNADVNYFKGLELCVTFYIHEKKESKKPVAYWKLIKQLMRKLFGMIINNYEW